MFAEQAFIEIIILLGHLSLVAELSNNPEHEILELFAGSARISRLARAAGMCAAAVDKAYCKSKHNGMDLNTSSGFLLLDLSWTYLSSPKTTPNVL